MYLKWLSHTLQFKSNCDGPQIMHHWFCFLFYRNSCFMCSKAVMSWIFWFPFFITWTMLDLTSVRMPLSSFHHIYDSHANDIKSSPHFRDRRQQLHAYTMYITLKKTTGTYWFFATVNSFFSGLFKNLILLSTIEDVKPIAFTLKSAVIGLTQQLQILPKVLFATSTVRAI